MALDSDNRRPPYVQIADALRAEIQAGQYQPGDRLPTVDALVQQYSVAKMTVQRALDLLRNEGYLVSWQGRGTYVRDVLPTGAVAEQSPDAYAEVTARIDELCTTIEELAQRVSDLESQAPRSAHSGDATAQPRSQAEPTP